VTDCTAHGIELVPVDALVGRGWIICRAIAWQASDRVRVNRQFRALSHAVVLRLAADEVTVVTIVISRQIQPAKRFNQSINQTIRICLISKDYRGLVRVREE